MAQSIVHWYPDLEKHRCGYCKQLNSNSSYGMWAEILTIEDYQNLIDRGWRRSGKYCYKPLMNITCCPLYTIRCEALNFKLSKSQKKILKKVNKYLSSSTQEITQANSRDSSETYMTDAVSEIMPIEKPVTAVDISKIDTKKFNLCSENSGDFKQTTNHQNDRFQNEPQSEKSNSNILDIKNYKPGVGADSSKPPCKKAKLIRLERRRQKLSAKDINPVQSSSNTNLGKSVEEFISEIADKPAHQLKICLVRTGGCNEQWERIRSQEYPVYKKYQMFVHNDAPEKCSEGQFTNFLFQSPLEIILKRINPKEATFLESAKLFEKYQMSIHNELKIECDLDSFNEFLVETPLKFDNPPDGPPNGYGSFHQQYWLDGKLIAVGVIDILPKCVSSVYFFYDPDYRHLTLGTYGSLREVEFTRQLTRAAPELKYYYMGFYIHSCPKMRYKANLTPSYLLCPETYQWIPIEKCVSLLDVKPYSRLNEDPNSFDENQCDLSDIDNILIILNYKTCIPYKYFKRKVQGRDIEFINFSNLVGKKCFSKLLLIVRDSEFS